MKWKFLSFSAAKPNSCISPCSQELVSAKNGNKLKKRLCIAVVVLVVIGLCIAALVHYGAVKPKESKESIERLASGSVALPFVYEFISNN